MSGEVSVDYRFRDLVHQVRLQFQLESPQSGDESPQAIQQFLTLKKALLDLIKQSPLVDPKDRNNLIYLQSIFLMLNQISNDSFLRDINLFQTINAYATRSTALSRSIGPSHDQRSQYVVAYQLMILKTELEKFKNIFQNPDFQYSDLDPQDFVIRQIQELLGRVVASLGQLETQRPDLMSFEPDYPVTSVSSLGSWDSMDSFTDSLSTDSPRESSPSISPHSRASLSLSGSSSRSSSSSRLSTVIANPAALKEKIRTLSTQRQYFTDLLNNTINNPEKRLVKIQLLMAIADGSFPIASKNELRPSPSDSEDLKKYFVLKQNNLALAASILGTQLGQGQFLCGLYDADSLSVLKLFQKAGVSNNTKQREAYMTKAEDYFKAVQKRAGLRQDARQFSTACWNALNQRSAFETEQVLQR